MLLLTLAPIAAIIIVLLSVMVGAKPIGGPVVADALFSFDPGQVDHQIIRHSRLPRVAGALLIGACLAVSGALMQGMTRNYLASPSIMGVSDGSVFVITLFMIIMPNAGSLTMIVYSLVGSALGAGIVFALAWLLPGGLSPVRMAVLGTIIGTFLAGVSQALSTYFQVSQNISFWYNARLHQMDPALIQLALPFVATGLVLAFVLARSITVLSLGDDIAQGLGQKTAVIKALTLISVILLTGISVALAGKIAFIGLIIPHICRFLVGQDYKRIIPCAAVFGGLFLAVCDLLSRLLNPPFETPVGVVTALFGVPFFLYLIKTKGGGKHA